MGDMCNHLTATLLRRVAHAVDGIRTGQTVFVVVDQEAPFRVSLMTEDEGEAREAAARSDTLCYCGPFETAREVGPAFLIHCHEPDSDWCEEAYVSYGTFNPPRKTPADPTHHLPKDTDVEQIKVEWTLKNGMTSSKTFRWRQLPGKEGTVDHMIDAFFFTQAAIDKFVVPYIATVQSSRTSFEFSQRLRDGIEGINAAQPHGKTNGRQRTIRLSEMSMVADLVSAEQLSEE